MVIFVNGIPVFTTELKTNLQDQNVINAISQYKTDRDQKEKLLSFKKMSYTFLRMTQSRHILTTRLSGLTTYFLPFNKGDKGSSGNPVAPKGKYKTSYIWEDILSKDSILIYLEIFIQEVEEVKEDKDGKKRKRRKDYLSTLPPALKLFGIL